MCQVCPTGTTCTANPSTGGGSCTNILRESQCGDGQDNDGDGKTDCADADCSQMSCGVNKVCLNGVCQ